MKDKNLQKSIEELTFYIENVQLTDIEKRETASALSSYLRHRGIYATITEIYRYINREIDFTQIRSRLQEAFEAKTEKEYIKVLNDQVL